VLQPAYELTEVSVAQRSFDQFKAEREERRRELEAAYKRFKKFVAERRG
jgi:ClpP class serine protease